MELSLFDAEDNFDRERYTKLATKIQYTPKSKIMPDVEQLYNVHKYNELVAEIDKSNCSDSVKKFLKLSASRHIVFDYEIIAEYYCHADKETQELMEKSGLVIIDIDDAMENGFLKLQKNLMELYDEAIGK